MISQGYIAKWELSRDFIPELVCPNLEVKWSEVKSLTCVWLFATPWTAACQAPLSMGFSRQEYTSGLPLPSPGDLPNPGIEPGSPALQADAFTVWATREVHPNLIWPHSLKRGLLQEPNADLIPMMKWTVTACASLGKSQNWRFSSVICKMKIVDSAFYKANHELSSYVILKYTSCIVLVTRTLN